MLLFARSDLTSFLMYSGYLGFAMSGLLKSYLELMKGVGSSARVIEIIELKPAIPRRPATIPQERLTGNIEFQDVRFAYPDRPEAEILRGLTLTIRESESLAIVGQSGAGKSTITNMLMRFHAPTSGTITVGGRALADIPHHYWMSRVGLVSQDSMLFAGSILDNLRVAKPDATEQEIIAACVAANAHAFIEKLPRGYETQLVGGTSLSGGQRQRLSIARTLLHSPQLLILDEVGRSLLVFHCLSFSCILFFHSPLQRSIGSQRNLFEKDSKLPWPDAQLLSLHIGRRPFVMSIALQ